jgi:superfamily II DNA or RNA helicase
MKEKALKETEGKKVVIATYAMAAEALDIKTLTTLIMATPKTDIEQSVGRILREKHSQPLVIDIVDSHDLFKNQWRKRKTFYRRENYKILYITSPEYTTDIDKWDTVYNPSCKADKKAPRSSNKKNTSLKSNSSTDKSIADESDDELVNDEKNCEKNEVDDKPKDKYACGKCFLTMKENQQKKS